MNKLTNQIFGGQILSAQLNGHNIFYCPPSIKPPPTPTRGGVPILFPQFNNQGTLTKHGFVRTQDWQVESSSCRMQAQLTVNEQANWPHRAQLTVEADLDDQTLTVNFTILNIGHDQFEWTGGLHPYFYVADVTQTQVLGLDLNLTEHHLETHEFTMSYPISQALIIQSPAQHLRIEQSGFDHWMVWNPSGQHALTDIPFEDWRCFLCVEPVCLTPVPIEAGCRWRGQMRISLAQYESSI